MAAVVAVRGRRDLAPRAVPVIRVLVLVEVDDGVLAKVDGIRARGPRAVVLVGVENLSAERFPSARRAAVHEARPARADRAVLLLEVRHQLVGDRVAVGAEVLRVHRVGVVVVRVGVLDLDDQVARVVGPRPVLVELVRMLFLDAVVALDVEALGVGGLEVRIRRRLPEAADRVGEVPVVDDERVARVRVGVEALGHEDVRAEVHRAAPELREPLREDPLVPDVLRRRGIRDGRNDLVELDRKRRRLAGLDRDLARRRVEIARRLAPLLPLAAVHRELHDVPVGAPERLVPVEERLDLVRPRRDRRETFDGIPEHVARDDEGRARLPSVGVDAEDLLRPQDRVAHLRARLGGLVLREDEEQAAVERFPALVGLVGDGKPEARRRRGRSEPGDRGQRQRAGSQ